MPISAVPPGRRYQFSCGETKIVERLVEAGEGGLSYSRLKAFTGLSDTALSKLLRRLQARSLIQRDLQRRYSVTVNSLIYLLSRNPQQISPSDLKAQKRTDLAKLWTKVRSVQEEVYRIAWLPYADATSRLFYKMAADSNPALLFIGAFKTINQKQILLFKTPTPEELERLGYLQPPTRTPLPQ